MENEQKDIKEQEDSITEETDVSQTVGPEDALNEALHQAEENLRGWQRAVADFENYKRRDEEHHSQLVAFGQDQAIVQFFDMVEDLDRVLSNTPESSGDLEEWKKGLEGVRKRLSETLKTLGVEKVETVGQKFDPDLHEAMMQVEGGESGVVAEEISTGYRRGPRLLKPARVKVYKG